MILIGRDLSPFVRRSATVMNLLGLKYERRIVATETDGDFIRSQNPLGRVPALILEDEVRGATGSGNQVIVDSSAIIDYALETAEDGPSLLPAGGPERRQVLYLSAIATGTMEKGVGSAYEVRMRPAEYVYAPYRERLLGQVTAGLLELEQQLPGEWFGGSAPNLADVNAVVVYDFVSIIAADLIADTALPRLHSLSERANMRPEFAETRWQPELET